MRWTLFLCLLLLTVGPGIGWGASIPGEESLRDAFFSTPQNGWAVGDRGAFWHTSDGGEHWKRLDAAGTADLTCIRFADEQRGWAAGVEVDPLNHTTSAVLLHTQDGGEHWKRDEKLLLPGFIKLQSFDRRQMVALTQPSPMFAANVFTSPDGGRSWGAFPPGALTPWTGGCFVNPQTGVLISSEGSTAQVLHRSIESQSTATGPGLTTAALTDRQQAWVAGEGGRLETSVDLGRSWRPPAGKLPDGIQELDLQALAAFGSHLWAAGAPGSVVLHSPDNGQTWEWQRTGQTVAIRALTFLDEQNGWGVGDLGTVLATHDGGKTWHSTAPQSRAAIYCLAVRAEDVPWETLAKLAANDGNLAVIEVLFAPSEVSRLATADRRLQTAALEVGAVSAEACRGAKQGPRSNESLGKWLATLPTEQQERLVSELENHLVRQIRQWRPTLMLVRGESTPLADDPVVRLASSAARGAADNSVAPQQLEGLGLQPWQVTRLLAAVRGSNHDSSSASAVLARLGRTAEEAASPAWWLLGQPLHADAPRWESQGTALGGPGAEQALASLALEKEGESRRAVNQDQHDQLANLRQSTQTRRMLQAITQRIQSGKLSTDQLLAELNRAAEPLPDDQAATFFWNVALKLQTGAREQVVPEVWRQIVARAPRSPQGGAALVRLLLEEASLEHELLRRRQQQGVSQQISLQPSADSPLQPTEEEPILRSIVPQQGLKPQAVVQTEQLPVNEVSAANSLAKTSALLQTLEQTHPQLAALPQVRLAWAAALRRGGQAKEADAALQVALQTWPHDAWWHICEGEQWLKSQRGNSPRTTWNVQRAAAPPHLDGQLTDACWEEAVPIQLLDPTGQVTLATAARASYDDRHLYLAFECPTESPPEKPAEHRPRSRDAELSGHDRIEVCLDVDRDHATAYCLAVDERGEVHDQLDGRLGWNPRWFVASSQTDHSWSVEAAIPLTELTDQALLTGQTWGVGLTRLLRTAGRQDWFHSPDGPAAPENFAWLRFR